LGTLLFVPASSSVVKLLYLLAEIDLLKQYLVRKTAAIARPRLSVENHHRPVRGGFGNYETFVSGRGI
jgi:hypothetical protein